MLPLHFDEGGHDGAYAESLDLSSENACEKRSGESSRDLVAKVAADEAGHGFIFAVLECGFLQRFAALGFVLVGEARLRGLPITARELAVWGCFFVYSILFRVSTTIQ